MSFDEKDLNIISGAKLVDIDHNDYGLVILLFDNGYSLNISSWESYWIEETPEPIEQLAGREFEIILKGVTVEGGEINEIVIPRAIIKSSSKTEVHIMIPKE